MVGSAVTHTADPPFFKLSNIPSMEKGDIYSEHSYAACISEGFKFLAKHLALICKVMLPYIAVQSLFRVLSYAINTKINTESAVALLTGKPIELTAFDITLPIMLILCILACSVISSARLVLLYRRIFGIESSEDDANSNKAKAAAWKLTINRTLQLAWPVFPYMILPTLLSMLGLIQFGELGLWVASLSTSWQVFLAIITLGLVIALIIFLAPLVHCYFCAVMRPTDIPDDTEGKALFQEYSFRNAYKAGLRSSGKIIGVTLLGVFIISIASIVPFLPGIISLKAYLSGVEGNLVFGDTTIIPASGYFFMIFFSTIAFAFVELLSITVITATLYLHGDIFSRTIAKKNHHL